jgi:hypothetical protein
MAAILECAMRVVATWLGKEATWLGKEGKEGTCFGVLDLVQPGEHHGGLALLLRLDVFLRVLGVEIHVGRLCTIAVPIPCAPPASACMHDAHGKRPAQEEG